MTARSVRCLFGAHHNKRVLLGKYTYHEFITFPEMSISEFMDKPDTAIANIGTREVYKLKRIAWYKEEIEVMVPSDYSDDEITHMVAEVFFR